MPERKAVARRQARVRENLHLLPKDAQEAILESLEGTQDYPVHDYDSESGRPRDEDADTAGIPTQRGY
jgi:phospholipid/cholesterol/gamma-HCH transport system ATP-binding protein